MGMISNIKDYLLRTSGLSPVSNYMPVDANDFISSYSKKIPLRSSKVERIKDVMDNVFKSSFDALKKVGNTPEKIMDAVNKLGLSVNRMMMPNGRTITMVSDNQGRSMSAVKAGITSDVASQVAKPTMTPSQERAKAATMRFANRLRNEPGSMEYAALSEFVKPFDNNGKVRGMARYGWDGLRQNINSLSIPKEYSRSGALMDITIRGNTTFIGVSMMSAGPRQDDTLKAMLHQALDMDLKIPDRKDGKPWNVESPIDGELANALYKQKDSPFLVGGKPEMIEGSAILLRDSNLLRLNAIAPELSPANLDKTMHDIGNKLEGIYTQQIRDAASPKEKKEATIKLEGLENNKNFMSYECMAMAKHLELQDKRQEDELKSIQAASDRMKKNPALYEALGDIFADDELIPAPVHQTIPSISPLTYEEIKRRKPSWEPGPENVSISMDGSLPHVQLRISADMQKELGLFSRDGNLTDISGFEITHLKPGIYPVDGAKDGFINIAESNGKRECLTTGIENAEPEVKKTKAGNTLTLGL